MKNQVRSLVESSGYSVWDSDEDCSGDLSTCLDHVKCCKAFLLLLTPNSANSPWVKEETKIALAKNNGKNRIVILTLDGDFFQSQKDEPWAQLQGISAAFYGEKSPKKKDALLSEDFLTKCQSACWNSLLEEYAQALRKDQPVFSNIIQGEYALNEDELRQCYLPRYLLGHDPQGKEFRLNEEEFLSRKGNALIYGEGGSGKSKYLKALLLRAYANDEDDQKQITLLLPCLEWVHHEETPLLEQLLQGFIRVEGWHFSLDLFALLLSHYGKKVTVCFDALDEIPNPAALHRLLALIRSFHERFPAARLIFTSRDKDDAKLLAQEGNIPVESLFLLPFSGEERERFAGKIFALIAPDASKAKTETQGFIINLKEIAEDIIKNPLLLTQLAILYDKTGQLPDTKIGILNEVTDVLLVKGEESKAIREKETGLEAVYLDALPSLLHQLAYRRYEAESEGLYPDNLQILQKIVNKGDPLEARALAKRILDYVTRRGFLVDEGFSFQLFAQYYAASYLYDASSLAFMEPLEFGYDEVGALKQQQSLAHFLEKRYGDPTWDTIIGFLICLHSRYLAESAYDTFFRFFVDHAKGELSLLFDTALMLKKTKRCQVALLKTIFALILEKTYRPYAQLFVYVPRYNLDEECLIAANEISAKLPLNSQILVLSLARDVVVGYGCKGYEAKDYCSDIKVLYALKAKASLFPRGVRSALADLFYGLKPAWLTSYLEQNKADPTYPFLFNLDFAMSQGVEDHPLTEPFEDELGLFENDTPPDNDGVFRGLVSWVGDEAHLSEIFNANLADEVTGLLLTPGEKTVFPFLYFDQGGVLLLALPANCLEMEENALASFGTSISSFKCVVPYGFLSLGKNAFAGSTSLRGVSLPCSLTSLGKNAFVGCSSLTRISLPPSLVSIGEAAFGNCRSLESVLLPAGLVCIDQAAFFGCSSLVSVSLPIGLTSIGQAAFFGCSSLVSVSLPIGLTSIGGGVFNDCSSLVKVDFPSALVSLGKNAFSGCFSLTSVSIPSSLGMTESEFRQFSDCPESTAIVVRKENASMKAGERPPFLKEEKTLPKDEKITDPGDWESNVKEASIPDGVVSIGEKTFMGCRSLVKVTFPPTLVSIGLFAFYRCSSLASVSFPSHLSAIGAAAFQGCSSLSKVILPESLMSIGLSAFSGCSSLVSVSFPSSLSSLASSAFQGCSSLAEVILPPSLVSLDHFAFSGCVSLVSAVLPSHLVSLGSGAFQGCSSLVKIALPSSLLSIGKDAFFRCVSLASILLPEGVTSIGEGAFEGCSSLEEDLILPKALRLLGEKAFKGCPLKSVVLSKLFRSRLKDIFEPYDHIEEVAGDSSVIKVVF